MLDAGASVGDVPRVTTETSIKTIGSLFSIFCSACTGCDGGSFCAQFTLLEDAADADVFDLELSSFVNLRRVLLAADSFAFMYDNAELLLRELGELLLVPYPLPYDDEAPVRE